MSVEHLKHYQNALTRLNNNGSKKRVETRIRFDIFDQISEIEISFPPSCFPVASESIELLRISSTIEGQRKPIEVTGIRGDSTGTRLSFTKDHSSVHIVANLKNSACEEGLTVKFEAWEIVTPIKGASPYDRGEVRLFMQFGEELTDGEHIILLDYPKSQTPRSTQGTHDFAYPSRTIGERRVQPLYFHQRKPIELNLIVGNNDSPAVPWVSLFKTSVSGFFVAAVASQIDSSSDNIKFFFGLLAAFAAATTVIWDVIEGLGKVQLYYGSKQRLSLLILLFQLVLLATISALILSIVGFELISLTVLLWAVLALAVTSLSLAVIGYGALLSGWLHGYRCDHLGCNGKFRWMRLRASECYYTGRVYCPKHVKSVCVSCVHHADLGRAQPRTSNQYTFDSPACLAERD
jgi:hypothetical protein